MEAVNRRELIGFYVALLPLLANASDGFGESMSFLADCLEVESRSICAVSGP